MKDQWLPTALVVDDNAKWLRTLTRLAMRNGYLVSTAQTYSEAMQELGKSGSPPDLVVTDIRLLDEDESNVDGLRLLNELAETGKLRASIVVTGYPNDETRLIAEKLGAIYLEKGHFDLNDFPSCKDRRYTDSDLSKKSPTT